MLADTISGLDIAAPPDFEVREFFSAELPSPSSAGLQEVLGAVRDHQWGELPGKDSWNSFTDNLVAYVVLLDKNRGVLLLYLDPYELYRNPGLLTYEMLADSDLIAMSSMR